MATVAQILFNSKIPEKYRDYKRNYGDPEVIPELLTRLAKELPPDEYRDVLRDVYKLGSDVSYLEGASFTFDDLRTPPNVSKDRDALSATIKKISERRDLSRQQRNDLITKTVSDTLDGMKKSMLDEASEEGNGLALQVRSKSRGKVEDLQSLLVGDMLMQDANGRLIPFPMMHGYSEGVDPAEYWAGTHGTRMGLLNVKLGTADVGYLCLSGDTLVRMGDGSKKPITEIVVGDTVTGADKSGNSFPTKVTATFYNGKKPVYSYRFRVGRSHHSFIEVRATEEHQVLSRLARGTRHSTRGELRPLRDSSMVGFNLVAANRLKGTGLKREPMAWIIGQMLGDGSTRGNGLTWSSNDPCYIERMTKEVQEFGCILNKVRNHPFEFSISVRPETRSVIYGNNGKEYQNPIRKRFDELGLLGKLANEKTLPIEVYSWDDESLFNLLAGIFESDGCVSTAKTPTTIQPIFTLSMTADRLVDTISDVMRWRFGLYGALGTDVTDKTPKLFPQGASSKSNFNMRRLTFSHADSLSVISENILKTGRKAELLRDLLFKHPPRSDHGSMSFKFIDKEYLGELDTYDIEVDHQDHLFVLYNGAVVSNSKRIKQVSHKQVITEDDCGTSGSIEAETKDPDNIGAVLALDTDGYKAGTIINATMLKKIKPQFIQVRSALTCQAKGGLCARCVGTRDTGNLPDIGDNVGMPAAQAISERATQQALNAKHSSGRASGKKAQFTSGFKLIEQLMDVPSAFKDASATADVDGLVDSIEPAPQGGQFIIVDGKKHHIQDGMTPTVKVGDKVEAGDLLSDGIPDPSLMVKYKGIGETRRIFTDQLRKATKANRRNAEIVGRSFVDYVNITDPTGFPNAAPDDIVKYSDVARDWVAREGTRRMSPGSAYGKYLELPTAHYTIGTKISHGVAEDLYRRGFKQIDVHDEAPPFEPTMVPSVRALTHAPDWQERMGGYHLKDSLLEAAARGMTSDMHGISYIPGVMRGTGFGDDLKTTGKY